MERRLGRATYVARQCLRKTAYGGKLRPDTRLDGPTVLRMINLDACIYEHFL